MDGPPMMTPLLADGCVQRTLRRPSGLFHTLIFAMAATDVPIV